MARATKLETQVAVHDVQIKALTERFDSFDQKLDAMTISLAKNKGFWGAVTLVLGAIWTAITIFGADFVKLLSGGR